MTTANFVKVKEKHRRLENIKIVLIESKGLEG